MTEPSDFSDVEDLTESYHDDDFLPDTSSSRKDQQQQQRFLSNQYKFKNYNLGRHVSKIG